MSRVALTLDDYLQIIVLGSVFQIVGFGLNAVIRGEGNPRVAMYTVLIGALLNTILDPIFLFRLGVGHAGSRGGDGHFASGLGYLGPGLLPARSQSAAIPRQ